MSEIYVSATASSISLCAVFVFCWQLLFTKAKKGVERVLRSTQTHRFNQSRSLCAPNPSNQIVSRVDFGVGHIREICFFPFRSISFAFHSDFYITSFNLIDAEVRSRYRHCWRSSQALPPVSSPFPFPFPITPLVIFPHSRSPLFFFIHVVPFQSRSAAFSRHH